MLKRLFLFFVLSFIYSSANADVRFWYNPYQPSCGFGSSAVAIADCVIDKHFSSGSYSRYTFDCETTAQPYYSGNGSKYYKPVKRSQYESCSRTTSYSALADSRLCPDGTTGLDPANGFKCIDPPTECEAPLVGTPPNCACPAGTVLYTHTHENGATEKFCNAPCSEGEHQRNPATQQCCPAGEYFDVFTSQCAASGGCSDKEGQTIGLFNLELTNGATQPPYTRCEASGCKTNRISAQCGTSPTGQYGCNNATYVYNGQECDPSQDGDGGDTPPDDDLCNQYNDPLSECTTACTAEGSGLGMTTYNCSNGTVISKCSCSATNEPPADSGDGSGTGTGDDSGDSTDTTDDGQTNTGDADADGDPDGDLNNDGDSDFGDIIDAISEQTRQIQDSIQQQNTQAQINTQRQVDAQTATTSAINEGTATISNAVNALSTTTNGNFQQNTAAINANGLRLDAVNTGLDAQTEVLEDIKTALEQGNSDDGNGSLTLPEGQDRQTVEEVGNKVLAAWERMKDAPIINAGAEVFGSFPSGGSCPPLGFNIELFGNSQNISTDIHCDLYGTIAPALSAVMLAFWGILAVLVFKRF